MNEITNYAVISTPLSHSLPSPWTSFVIFWVRLSKQIKHLRPIRSQAAGNLAWNAGVLGNSIIFLELDLAQTVHYLTFSSNLMMNALRTLAITSLMTYNESIAEDKTHRKGPEVDLTLLLFVGSWSVTGLSYLRQCFIVRWKASCRGILLLRCDVLAFMASVSVVDKCVCCTHHLYYFLPQGKQI